MPGRSLGTCLRANAQSLQRTLPPVRDQMRRVARRGLRHFDAMRRRAIADALQPGEANIWQDPHFF